jgi:nitroreductase
MSHPKYAQTDHDIHELIARRWSPRAFDPSRSIPRDELLRLFEAARWSPSSMNEQPWAFLVVDRQHSAAAHATLFATLTGRNQAWAASAPVLVLVAVRTSVARGESGLPSSWYDAGQAVAFLTLQATAQGISVRQMEGFDRDRARIAGAVPAEFVPAVVMALGYAGDPEGLAVERHRSAELQPRVRRPISEFTFDAVWGRGLA